MKSFFHFLKEAAAGSTAVQQAQRMGLVGDGHGGWYDKKTGEFVAKTEKGVLKFYNKRQRVGAARSGTIRKGKESITTNFTTTCCSSTTGSTRTSSTGRSSTCRENQRNTYSCLWSF